MSRSARFQHVGGSQATENRSRVITFSWSAGLGSYGFEGCERKWEGHVDESAQERQRLDGYGMRERWRRSWSF